MVRPECRQEALDLADAIQKIIESPEYGALVAAIDSGNRGEARRILARMRVKNSVIQYMFDKPGNDPLSPNSVSFRWV